MMVGTIRPMALSRLSQEFLSVMISRRCHSALYGCLVHGFLPEVAHGSLARVQVPARHSRCGASKALRARGSPPSHSILLDLNSSQMVQGIRWSEPTLELRRLVETLGMPFMTSPVGRGFIPDDHPLNLGTA